MNLFNIFAKFGVDDTKFKEGVGNAEKKVISLKGALTTVGGAIASAFAVKKVIDFTSAVTRMGISYNAALETSSIAWETLLGSQEKSAEMLKRIEEFAAKTPFEKMGVDNMAKQLHNAGLKGDDLFNQLTKFGDMGGAFGVQAASLEEMVRQYSQVKQAGVAYTEDLNILQDRGIPIYKAIAEELGINVSEVKKWASEGKISAEIYQNALDSVAESVAGGMEKQSQTFSGMLSTLKDGFAQAAGILTQPIFETLKMGLNEVLPILDGFISALGENGIVGGVNFLWGTFSEKFPQAAEIVKLAFGNMMDIWNTILKPCLDEIKNIITNVLYPAFKEVFLELIVPICKEAFDKFLDIWNTIGKPLFDIIVDVIYYLYEQFEKYFPAIKEVFEIAMKEINDVWENTLKPCLEAIISFLKEYVLPGFKWVFETIIVPLVSNTFKGIKTMWDNILKPALETVVNFLKNVFSMEWAKSLKKVIDTVQDCYNKVKEKAKSFINIGKDIVTGLWNGIVGMKDWIVNKVKGFFGNIVDAAKGMLGIHSPSLVFKNEVGKYMAQGVGVGFDEEMNNVNKDIENAINTNLDIKGRSIDGGNIGLLNEIIYLLKNISEKDLSLNIDGREFTRSISKYNDEFDKYNIRNNPLLSY